MASKSEIFGWSMYDFANTIFSALFITIYFPLLVVLKGGNAFHVGLVMSASLILAGFVVPYAGALVDLTGKKKILLGVFTAVCCAATFFAGFFSLGWVIALGIIAVLFYHLCLDIYDSLLTNISTRDNMGHISGVGTAVGYAGTILAVVVAYLIGWRYGFESLEGIIGVFIATAFLFLVFALPLFLKFPKIRTKPITLSRMKQAALQVFDTIKGIKKYQTVWLFLLASLLYADAANTAIIFLFLFARDQIGLSLVQFLPLYIGMAISAALGSLIFGKLSDHMGPKQTLLGILLLWISLITMLYLKTTMTTFILTGIIGGALLGGIWTATRPMLISLAPKKKVAELFGYQGLTEKFSGVIGPLLFGWVAVAFGFQSALLVVIVLFFGGGLALLTVKEK